MSHSRAVSRSITAVGAERFPRVSFILSSILWDGFHILVLVFDRYLSCVVQIVDQAKQVIVIGIFWGILFAQILFFYFSGWMSFYAIFI